jgi:ribosomal protein S19
MPEMVGQKFGSFCPTRKYVRSKGKDKSKPIKK